MKLRAPFARPAGDAVYGYTGHVCQLRPESRGEIRLWSNDPAAPPVIRANYLATETDRRVMRDGFKTVREIFRQRAFDEIRGPSVLPAEMLESDAAIDAWIAAHASTVFHPAGTCRMGVDAASVVDEELRVRGVAGPARGRCVGDAAAGERQHPRADRHDRRARRAVHPRCGRAGDASLKLWEQIFGTGPRRHRLRHPSHGQRDQGPAALSRRLLARDAADADGRPARSRELSARRPADDPAGLAVGERPRRRRAGEAPIRGAR